jgi:hypothetical protein
MVLVKGEATVNEEVVQKLSNSLSFWKMEYSKAYEKTLITLQPSHY